MKIPDFSYYFEALFCKIVRNPAPINKVACSTDKKWYNQDTTIYDKDFNKNNLRNIR